MKAQKKESNQILVKEASEIIADQDVNRDEKLQAICRLLANKVDAFDWVGFYLPHPELERELILGPFTGEETEHTQISYGHGICGQSAATEETFVVQDVDAADNYISCSADVKAEIVAPVMKDGNFAAELDIDSHKKNAITVEHRKLVEKICDMISPIF